MSQPRNVNISVPITGYEAVEIENESVTIPAGDVGDVVDFYLLKKPIADNNGAWIGGNGDTSISFTSDIFDTEVAYIDDSGLANGEYWIDYVRGRGRGRKADAGTSISITYSIFQNL
jgi:hypothetical protein